MPLGACSMDVSQVCSTRRSYTIMNTGRHENHGPTLSSGWKISLARGASHTSHIMIPK